MPKISVLMPVYNVEQYLVESMESVTRQTLHDLEIICINDGSTDGSLEILRKYAAKDDRIIIVDKENGGYGVGMNIALDMATGEYIAILEPDDFIPVTMYEDLYAKVKDYDLDFVKSDFYRFTRAENGNMELTYFHLTQDTTKYNVVFNPSQTPEAIRFTMNTWTGIYRRSFLEKYHIRHNETPGASFQDNGFFFQTFAYAERAMILDKPYYMNRRDNPNSSVKSMQKIYCLNAEYDHIRRLLCRDEELWNRFKYYYWFKRYYNYTGTLARIADEYRMDYVYRISAEYKRARLRGELKEEAFSAYAWGNLNLLISDPEQFYNKLYAPEVLRKKNMTPAEKLQAEKSAHKKTKAKLTKKLQAEKRAHENTNTQLTQTLQAEKSAHKKTKAKLTKKLKAEQSAHKKTNTQLIKTKKELNKLRKSRSYRLGRALLAIPIRLKRALKKLGGRK